MTKNEPLSPQQTNNCATSLAPLHRKNNMLSIEKICSLLNCTAHRLIKEGEPAGFRFSRGKEWVDMPVYGMLSGGRKRPLIRAELHTLLHRRYCETADHSPEPS